MPMQPTRTFVSSAGFAPAPAFAWVGDAAAVVVVVDSLCEQPAREIAAREVVARRAVNWIFMGVPGSDEKTGGTAGTSDESYRQSVPCASPASRRRAHSSYERDLSPEDLLLVPQDLLLVPEEHLLVREDPLLVPRDRRLVLQDLALVLACRLRHRSLLSFSDSHGQPDPERTVLEV